MISSLISLWVLLSNECYIQKKQAFYTENNAPKEYRTREYDPSYGMFDIAKRYFFMSFYWHYYYGTETFDTEERFYYLYRAGKQYYETISFDLSRRLSCRLKYTRFFPPIPNAAPENVPFDDVALPSWMLLLRLFLVRW